MLEYILMEQWSPYVVGICIGILGWLAFLLSDKSISCSSAFARTSGMIEKLFRGKKVDNREYYKEFRPIVDWGWMLVVGIFIGAFIASALSGDFKLRWLPSLWSGTFGTALLPRILVAFIGGALMGFASRWVNGCTSGHSISGTMQLAVSSWISTVFFFIGGTATALAIFHLFS